LSIVLGYHGCSLETAQALLSGSSFVVSDRPWDWLGNGSYFWEEDILRAYEWALERRSLSPCAVGAVIERGNCLDLTTQRGVRALKGAYRLYVEWQANKGQPMPANRPAASGRPGDLALRLLDRAVLEHLHFIYKSVSNKEFDTVRALFPEGDRLYENAGFFEKTHVQIAVRKPEQILGVFRIPGHQLAELGLPNIYEKL
jgi:hypothetical protein